MTFAALNSKHHDWYVAAWKCGAARCQLQECHGSLC